MKRANIIKPQNAFEQKVDNFYTGPWKPLLTTKPHATLPLDKSLATYVDADGTTQYEHLSFLPLSAFSSCYMRQCVANGTRMKKRRRRVNKRSGIYQNANNKTRFKHPYETEILNLTYPKRIYEKRDAVPYLPFESTTATWVDTYEGVLEMLEELKKAKEIAVDLEHHDYRTYTGLTSLMQISTREKDWVVDTLRPWRHKLEVLNEVFADPDIIKVDIETPTCRCSFTNWRRSCTARLWTLFGCNGIWVCISSAYLTRTTHAMPSIIPGKVWRSCLRSSATSTRTRSTRWPIGGYGIYHGRPLPLGSCLTCISQPPPRRDVLLRPLRHALPPLHLRYGPQRASREVRHVGPGKELDRMGAPEVQRDIPPEL